MEADCHTVQYVHLNNCCDCPKCHYTHGEDESLRVCFVVIVTTFIHWKMGKKIAVTWMCEGPPPQYMLLYKNNTAQLIQTDEGQQDYLCASELM